MQSRRHRDQFQYLCKAQTESMSNTLPRKAGKRTVAFDVDLEFGAFIVEAGKVIVVELRPENGVTMHYVAHSVRSRNNT